MMEIVLRTIHYTITFPLQKNNPKKLMAIEKMVKISFCELLACVA